MNKTLRGRLRPNFELAHILAAAARELGCSDAYVHVRLKRADLTLRKVLEAPSLEALL